MFRTARTVIRVGSKAYVVYRSSKLVKRHLHNIRKNPKSLRTWGHALLDVVSLGLESAPKKPKS